jgi:hypothetical protein
MESDDRTEKCKEVFSLLSEYLNLELPPEACQEIETHLPDARRGFVSSLPAERNARTDRQRSPGAAAGSLPENAGGEKERTAFSDQLSGVAES